MLHGRPFSAPRLDELSVLVEFQNPRIPVCTRRVALRDEDVTIGRNRNVVWFIEELRRFIPGAALAFGSKRQ